MQSARIAQLSVLSSSSCIRDSMAVTVEKSLVKIGSTEDVRQFQV